MARITWTDSHGTATLHNEKSAPGDRFMAWTPDHIPFGDRASNLATGLCEVFTFRDDYLVSFEMRTIPTTLQDLMLRLKSHLLRGGLCTVATEDNASRTYTCGLSEDGEVAITQSNTEGVIEYTMAFARLLNTAQAPLLCIYGV